MSESEIAISHKNLTWDNDTLEVPDDYNGPVWEAVEESYHVIPIEITNNDVTSTVWLHSSARRKWNTFAQKNWSKAWTTDSKEGGNYVKVAELRTWLSSFISDGNNSREKSVSNGHFVEQGPHSQDNTPWPGFTPYQLCHQAWCKGPTIRTEISCSG